MRIYLVKKINATHIRYYNMSLMQTLFGEIEFECVYGNIAFKSHTGKKVHFFQNMDEAGKRLEQVLMKKLKRGYQKRMHH